MHYFSDRMSFTHVSPSEQLHIYTAPMVFYMNISAITLCVFLWQEEEGAQITGIEDLESSKTQILRPLLEIEKGAEE